MRSVPLSVFLCAAAACVAEAQPPEVAEQAEAQPADEAPVAGQPGAPVGEAPAGAQPAVPVDGAPAEAQPPAGAQQAAPVDEALAEAQPPEGDTGAIDPCEDFEQPGCVHTGCPEGQVCDTSRECVPTLCACDPVSGQSICSLDCDGGTCVDEADQCAPLVCRLLCPYGFVTDDRGCEICECQPRPRCGCVSDEDCAKVVAGCCPCSLGGAEQAIAVACVDQLAQCPVAPEQVPCVAFDNCTDRVARCVAGECALQNPI